MGESLLSGSKVSLLPPSALCLGLLLVCTMPVSACRPIASRYAITDLGTRLSIDPFDGTTYPLTVNEQGQVAGSETVAGEGMDQVWRAVIGHGRRWRMLGKPEGFTSTYANGFNAADQVAGYGESTVGTEPVRTRDGAFVWSGTGARLLPGLGGDVKVIANGINSHGDVAGYSRQSDLPFDDFSTSALLWRGSRSTVLGTLGGTESYANAVNDQDQIVGSSELGLPTRSSAEGRSAAGRHDTTLTPPTTHAFLWENGRMRDLGSLPGDNDCVAMSINENGDVVGYAEYDGPLRYPQPHAFWYTGGRMRDLGAGKAWAVSDQRVIVGTAGEHAVLWQHGVRLFLDRLVSRRLGWRLGEARGINGRGQIVGFGTLRGKLHAFLLTPK